MKIIILIVLSIAPLLSLPAEVLKETKNKGKYYEVHESDASSYTFYYVLPFKPSSPTSSVILFGIRDDMERAAFEFPALQAEQAKNVLGMKDALKKGLIRESDLVVVLTVDVAAADRWILYHGKMGEGTNGIVYETELKWLLGESKKDRRFKRRKKAEQGVESNR